MFRGKLPDTVCRKKTFGVKISIYSSNTILKWRIVSVVECAISVRFHTWISKCRHWRLMKFFVLRFLMRTAIEYSRKPCRNTGVSRTNFTVKWSLSGGLTRDFQKLVFWATWEAISLRQWSFLWNFIQHSLSLKQFYVCLQHDFKEKPWRMSSSIQWYIIICSPSFWG